MKLLSNCSVTKLKEYSKCYGGQETISVQFIEEMEGEIKLLNEYGEHIRTLRKFTKLLISFEGKEITERQFNILTKKAIVKRLKEREARQAEYELIREAKNRKAAEQGEKWKFFLSENPNSANKYKEKCNTMPSSKWRNYLRMKAAKHINNENFTTLEISAPELKQILFSI